MSQEMKYIIGVSGGSDSMALLHMLQQKGIQLIVAHVNYKKRDTAQRDQDLVENFCGINNIPFELLVADEYIKGNFQKWAREKRYSFFDSLTKKYKGQGVYIAHQLDDLLETYYIQKDRKSIPLYWGLKEKTEINGLLILRPLLQYEKKELVDYCLKEKIPFAEDESNATDAYERNRIRHNRIENMSKQQKLEVLVQIDTENKILEDLYQKIEVAERNSFNPYSLEKYQSYTEEIRLEALRRWLMKQAVDSKHFTNKHLREIDKLLLKAENVFYSLKNNKYFYISYQEIGVKEMQNIKYSYTIEKGEHLNTSYFRVSGEGKSTEAVTVSDEEYPLQIRNWEQGDSIQMRYGNKRISRWFIDQKIPVLQREVWPIVLNNRNEIILVPGIGCNITHFSNNPSLFVIK